MTANDVHDVRRPLRILVIDDDPQVLEVVMANLKRRIPAHVPVRVDGATSPRAAWRLASTVDPGDLVVIVSDYDFNARITGVQLLARLTDRFPDSMRVLMSASSRSELIDAGGSKVAHLIVEKPLDFRDLTKAIMDFARVADSSRQPHDTVHGVRPGGAAVSGRDP